MVYSTKNIKAAKANSVVDLDVVDVSFPNDDYENVIGRVVNNTDEDITEADLVYICYDEKHNIVAMTGDIVSIDAHGKSSFDLYCGGAYGKKNIADYEIFARKIEW